MRALLAGNSNPKNTSNIARSRHRLVVHLENVKALSLENALTMNQTIHLRVLSHLLTVVARRSKFVAIPAGSIVNTSDDFPGRDFIRSCMTAKTCWHSHEIFENELNRAHRCHYRVT
jgi:hypothetical protein